MPEHRNVGTYRGVAIDVAAWDAVGAMVDLSCAGMFTHEVDGAPLVGGLLDLDTVLEGRLWTLRAERAFRAERMETMMFRTLPPAIRADAVLMIGLGSPDDWTADVMEQATRVAVREANRVGVARAGIAPGMLDSGLAPDRTGSATSAMLRGVTGGIDAEMRLVELGLARQPSMTSWTFGTGAAHLDEATFRFRATLQSIDPPSS